MNTLSNAVKSHPYVVAAIAVTIPSLILAKNTTRKYLLRTFTVLLDLPDVTKPRSGPKIQETAVICGGSIAGLFTARLLADHYAKILVIEPENFVFTPESWTLPLAPLSTRETTDSETGEIITGLSHKRTRVWQYVAMHVYQILLVRFLRIVFPTFDQRAKDAGLLIATADWKFWFGGMQGLIPSGQYHDRDHETLYGSRRAVEAMLRALVVETGLVTGLEGVRGDGTIEFVKGTVTAFKLSADKKTIASVSYRAESGKIIDVPSSLVSDCTGNTQAGLKFLSRALEQPSLTDLRIEYNPKMFYSTIEIPIPSDFDERVAALGLVDPVTKKPMDVKNTGFFMSWVPEPAVDYRTLLLGRLEGRMAFGIGGWDSALPTTWKEAVAYARDIDTPCKVPEWFFQILDILGADGRSEQITISPARFASASRILYENRPGIIPANYVAIGDSSMRLNPRLGEGVTKSAVGAIILDALLRERLPGDPKFGPTFFTRLAARTSSLWDGAKWLDYGRESTVPCKNESLAEGSQFRWLNQKIDVVMARNSYAAEQFWRNFNFLAPTSDVLAPSVLLHACKVAIFG